MGIVWTEICPGVSTTNHQDQRTTSLLGEGWNCFVSYLAIWRCDDCILIVEISMVFTNDIVCDIMYLAFSLAANQMPTKMYSKNHFSSKHTKTKPTSLVQISLKKSSSVNYGYLLIPPIHSNQGWGTKWSANGCCSGCLKFLRLESRQESEDSWGFGAKFASKHRLKCQQKNRMHPVLGSK